MSGRLSIRFIDFAAVSPAFDRLCCVSMMSFLVRNWCGCQFAVRIGSTVVTFFKRFAVVLSRLKQGFNSLGSVNDYKDLSTVRGFRDLFDRVLAAYQRASGALRAL